VRLSFERVHDDQTDKDPSHTRAGEAATSANAAEGRAARSSDTGEITSKPMLLGYARVSTVDQNLALQRDALTEAGCAKIFTEQMSGAVTDRPALHDALEFARSGDTLIVWKLDRLARSMKQLIETVETLRLRGIGFRSLTEALDTTTAGLLVFHMFGALAEFERSLIRERTQAGLAAARRAARTGGRPPKLTYDDIEAAKAMLANPDIPRDSDRTPPRRLAGDAVSIYARRADREHPRRLRRAALSQKRDAPGRFQPGGGRRLCPVNSHSDGCDRGARNSSSPRSAHSVRLDLCSLGSSGEV
jgi:DNA invertase Pin-like site-specific DNA recombinase